jgi:hypothetical protein
MNLSLWGVEEANEADTGSVRPWCAQTRRATRRHTWYMCCLLTDVGGFLPLNWLNDNVILRMKPYSTFKQAQNTRD